MYQWISCRLWGAFNVIVFNTIIFLMAAAHLRAVMSDPGIVPIPEASLDFTEMQQGKQTTLVVTVFININFIFSNILIIMLQNIVISHLPPFLHIYV